MKIRGQVVHSAKDRILNMVNVCTQTECWNWKGSLRNGYGRMIAGSRLDKTRKSVTAHVFSYKAFVGEVPEGLFVLHKCDNKKCCNPSHLFVGTKKDNALDMVAKNRCRNGTTGKLPDAPKEYGGK